MIKIRKKIIFVLGFVFVLLIGVVSAAEVCVIVQYPDLSADSECVDIAENADGYEVLETTSLDLIWKYWEGFGAHSLCKINDVGRSADNCLGDFGSQDSYWNLNLLENGEWAHSNVGFDGTGGCTFHYCAKNGYHVGLAYGFNEGGGVYPEMLNVKDIKFYVDNDKESGTIKLRPDSKLEVKVELENLYSKESDIEINNVLVTVTIDSIDDGEDIEEESDEFDLKPEKDKTAKVELNIPLEVEEDDYDLEIIIEARDDLGVEYEIEKKYEVEVDKKSHELIFHRLNLENDELMCNRETNLDINIMNLGTKEEDTVLEINNNELNLNKKLEFTLSEDPFDDDNRFSGLIPIKISEDVKAGNYVIAVKAIYNKGNDERKKTLNLVIKECESKISEKIEEGEKKKKEVIEEEEMEKITGQVIYEETSKDYSVLFVGLAAIIIIVALLIGIVLLVKKS